MMGVWFKSYLIVLMWYLRIYEWILRNIIIYKNWNVDVEYEIVYFFNGIN